jgi:ribonucleoside-diphosphate reductase alpha chain
LSVLPYDGGTYTQAPFEDITKKKFIDLKKSLINIDLFKIIENEDNTDLKGELACTGGACEIV